MTLGRRLNPVSVVVEFTVAPDEFLFAGALPDRRVTVELERQVPVGDDAIPNLWVSGERERVDAFAAAVRDLEPIVAFERVEAADDDVLFDLEVADPGAVLSAVRATDGALLWGRWNRQWLLRARFADRESASAFVERAAVDVERVGTEAGRAGPPRADLTDKQREALTTALDAGYFASPKGATLDEIAADIGISPQALSKRLRRATELVVRTWTHANGRPAPSTDEDSQDN
jgi:hypothetical protein